MATYPGYLFQEITMNLRATYGVLTALVLVLGSSVVQAADQKTAPDSPISSKSQSSTKSDDRPLVDINSANAAALKTLPGIGDPEAQKIIAHRPYSTKAQLVVRNVVDGATYEGLRKKVVAGQPYKDTAKNAAIYAKQKQPDAISK